MKVLKIIGKFFATILSVLLFFLFIVIMLLYAVKGVISSENLSNYIRDSKILNMDVNVIFNKEESGDTLEEKIKQIALEVGIPKEIADDIIKSEEINEILGDFFSKTIIYVIDGGDKPQISSEVTNKMKEAARMSLEEHINIMMDEKELDNFVDKYSSKLTNLIPEREQIIGGLQIDFMSKIINFNPLYLYLILGSIVIFIMLLLFSVYKSIKYVSIPMILSGVLFVIVGCLSNVINESILSNINNMKELIMPFVTNFLTIIFKIGILVSFSGLLLFIIYVVINRIIINNKRNDMEKTKRIDIEDIKL